MRLRNQSGLCLKPMCDVLGDELHQVLIAIALHYIVDVVDAGFAGPGRLASWLVAIQSRSRGRGAIAQRRASVREVVPTERPFPNPNKGIGMAVRRVFETGCLLAHYFRVFLNCSVPMTKRYERDPARPNLSTARPSNDIIVDANTPPKIGPTLATTRAGGAPPKKAAAGVSSSLSGYGGQDRAGPWRPSASGS